MATLSLQKLTLSHFRSHRHVHLDFDPRPIAIYGANGAGKTNLIEAVSMLSPGRGMRRASPDELTRRPEAIGWKISGLLKKVPKGAAAFLIAQPLALRLLMPKPSCAMIRPCANVTAC